MRPRDRSQKFVREFSVGFHVVMNEFPEWVPAAYRATLQANGWFATRYRDTIAHAGGYEVLRDDATRAIWFRSPEATMQLLDATVWRRALEVQLSDQREVAERIRAAMAAYDARKAELANDLGMIPLSDPLLCAAFDAMRALIGVYDFTSSRLLVREADRDLYDAEYTRLVRVPDAT